ncbi:MAG: hypothetical protein HQK86_12710 [Nitrospinae bacterium]|nr:hypothetical protein [Nitrospinota bacterium]
MANSNIANELSLTSVARLLAGEDPNGVTTIEPVRKFEILLVQSVRKLFLEAYLYGEPIIGLTQTGYDGSYSVTTLLDGAGIQHNDCASYEAVNLSDFIIRRDDFLKFVSDNPCYWENDPGTRPYVCGNALMGWTSQMYSHRESQCKKCNREKSCQYAPPEKPCTKCEYTVFRSMYATNPFWDNPHGANNGKRNNKDKRSAKVKAAKGFELKVKEIITKRFVTQTRITVKKMVAVLKTITGLNDDGIMMEDLDKRRKSTLEDWIRDCRPKTGPNSSKAGRPSRNKRY